VVGEEAVVGEVVAGEAEAEAGEVVAEAAEAAEADDEAVAGAAAGGAEDAAAARDAAASAHERAASGSEKSAIPLSRCDRRHLRVRSRKGRRAQMGCSAKSPGWPRRCGRSHWSSSRDCQQSLRRSH
jgi:hypothetical protein